MNKLESFLSKYFAEYIIEMVSVYYGVERNTLMGKSRKGNVIKARHVCRYLLKFNTDLKLVEIAELMKGPQPRKADHTTIIHSCNLVGNLMETDDDFDNEVAMLQCIVKKKKMKEIDDYERELIKKISIKKPVIILPDQKVVRMDTLSESEKVTAKYLG